MRFCLDCEVLYRSCYVVSSWTYSWAAVVIIGSGTWSGTSQTVAATWPSGDPLEHRAAAAAMMTVSRSGGSPRLGSGGSGVALAKCRGRLQRYGRLGSYWCQRRCGTWTECGARCTKTLLVLVNFAFLASIHLVCIDKGNTDNRIIYHFQSLCKFKE